MSPASYLAAPPRVAPSRIPEPAGTIARVPWWTWVAIGVFVLAAAGGGVGLVLLALRTFRRLGASGRSVSASLDELSRAGERLAASGEAPGGRSEELERSVGRLRASIRRLTVLLRALVDARDTVLRATSLVPRK